MRKVKRSIFLLAFLQLTFLLIAEEKFVILLKVTSSKITVSESSGGKGKGRRGGAGSSAKSTTLSILSNAKITAAQKERRTGEFRVGVALSGGLRNPIFKDLGNGIAARIITDSKGKVIELNVVSDKTDINQSNSDSKGGSVIAVKPKRPPMKR